MSSRPDIEIMQITVAGPTASGKSHVMAVIEKALKAEYGNTVQVASYDLATERNLVGDNLSKPNVSRVVFVLQEDNQPTPTLRRGGGSIN